MKVAIMQPYFFPYIGYFQLINAVDSFVFYDDVNFIKGGWINKNNILLNNQSFSITIDCEKISSNKLIKDTYVTDNQHTKKKLVKILQNAYMKAVNYSRLCHLVENIVLDSCGKSIVQVGVESIKSVCEYTNLERRFYCSSELDYDKNLPLQDKIIAICKILGAKEYINMMGGALIYNREYFRLHGLELNFLSSVITKYRQYSDNHFVGGLSIIDVLMFNSPATVRQMFELGVVG